MRVWLCILQLAVIQYTTTRLSSNDTYIRYGKRRLILRVCTSFLIQKDTTHRNLQYSSQNFKYCRILSFDLQSLCSYLRVCVSTLCNVVPILGLHSLDYPNNMYQITDLTTKKIELAENKKEWNRLQFRSNSIV